MHREHAERLLHRYENLIPAAITGVGLRLQPKHSLVRHHGREALERLVAFMHSKNENRGGITRPGLRALCHEWKLVTKKRTLL
jgi:hypothetical protein